MADSSRPHDDSHPDDEHPRGALLFILTYLVLVAILWTDVYLRLLGGA